MNNVIDSIQVSGTVYTLSAQTSGGGNPTVELTQAEYDALVTAGTVSADTYYIITDAQAGDLTNYYTKSETNTLLGGKADTATTYTKTEVDNAITAATSTKQDTLVSGTNIKTINNTSILGSGNIDIQGGGIDSGTVQTMIDESISGKVDTSAFTAYSASVETALSGKQDTLTAGTNITIVDNVISAQLEGGTVSRADVEDMISAATSGLVESSAITSAVTSASTDSEIPTAKAVYDAIPTGGTGGGKAISAGTNISVTTGETADTINCTLPISADTGGIYTTSSYPFISNAPKGYNAVFGNSNVIDVFGSIRSSYYNALFGNNNGVRPVSGSSSSHFIAGSYNNVKGANNYWNALFGYYNNSQNNSEFGCGQYNVSSRGSSTFGDSGNTLFSVGNGTADNARHNAFEIRQNGDIYLTKDGQDVKLQDQLGGGASYSAGTGIDITNNVISVSGVVETSAITTSITSGSTDSQIPSAKAVYDILGNIETLLSQI